MQARSLALPALRLRMAMCVVKAKYRLEDADRNVPRWFLFLFDGLLWTMWGYHDYVLCIIFGRGDGR